jgi:uncharacterized protein YdbL (DUF1318 family)
MRTYRHHAAAAFASAVMLCGCAGMSDRSCCLIAAPEIHITGEKTVIERQIVGDYRELESDAWVISSVKTDVQKSKGSAILPGGDEVLFRAMKVREYNEGYIRAYKDEGALGEAYTGYVAYREHRKYEGEPEEKARLQRVLLDENEARKTIFERSLALSGDAKPSAGKVAAFGAQFAGEQAALAKKGDWLQEKSGRWMQKK